MRALLIVALAAAACAGDGSGEDDLGSCEVAFAPRAGLADRKVLGQGAPYAADLALRGQAEALAGSQRLRREAAWRTVTKVVGGVGLVEGGALPRWQTWYGRDDVTRVFQRLYEGLGAAGRSQRSRFSEGALDEAFGWNARAVDEAWDGERWQAYRDAMDRDAELAGAGGIGRVGYSPSAARHLLGSYAALLQCAASGVPPAFVDGPPAAERQLAREDVRLAACEARPFGPYAVAGGETLRARFEGDAVVELDGGACTAGGCEARGPGLFEVVVRGGAEPSRGVLTVDHHAPQVAWAPCLTGAFAADSVVVKADWRRVLPGMTLPVFDTSARGLGAREWRAEGEADPGAEAIYTLELPGGQVYRLAALHVMSKELDHWQWVTLWWSPDADSDFGADRPDEVEGVWRNYKMCTAVAFSEGDPRPDGGLEGSLGAALAAVHGPESWCSNPYLEAGPGNAATNCIGCHQHAGTGVSSERVLGEDAHRRQKRNNFPADYAWAVDHGDALTAMFAEVVAYWDAAR